jgi:hypothetical protein
MRYRWSLVFLLGLMCCLGAAGKDKKKILLPTVVLEARTVMVVVDPEAGVALDDRFGNRQAQEDVEKALMKWGRFRLEENAADAELIISVHRGNGKIARPAIGGVPINNRPVIFEPTDSGGRVGGQAGNPQPGYGDPTGSRSQGPSPGVEVGDGEDMFAVYLGKRPDPLNWLPVWRYGAEDGLRSPGVPAVEVFRKLIVEAEKQQAAKP